MDKVEPAKKAIIQKGRDNTRIPIPVRLASVASCYCQTHLIMSQWTEDPHGGFTAPSAKPWLPAPDHASEWCHASQQKCPDSVWSFYRTMIQLRKSHPTLVSHRAGFFLIKPLIYASITDPMNA